MPQQFYLKNNNQALVLEDKPFASGGEGSLYNILQPATYVAGYVAKIIHPHKLNPVREAKVLYLINNRPQFEYNPEHQPIIWIEQALYNEKSEFVGFIMPRATGEKLEILCAPRLPKRLGQEWQQLQLGTEKALRLRLKVCYNIALAVQQIHASGRYVLVDLKPDNVMIQSNGLISLVDTDSVEVVEAGQMLFSATVATPDYTPPEYYSKNMEVGKTPIDESWDRFSLAVIFYRIMLGIHPFAASCRAPYDNLAALADKIKYGFFAHDISKQDYFSVIPPPHAKFKKLDEEIQQLFISTFDDGHDNPEARATPNQWLAIIPNSSTAIIDRPLPSEVLDLPNVQTENWYEMAIKQILNELNLNAPVVSKFDPNNTNLIAGAASSLQAAQNGWKQNKTTIVIVMISFFGFVLGVGSLLRASPIELFLIAVLGLIAILIYFWRKFSLGDTVNKIGSSIQNKYKSLTNRKKLEDIQHKLFAQRVEYKQRQKEIATELTVVEGVKSKRDKTFLKSQSALVNQVQQKTSQRLQKLNLNSNPDQTAQQLMVKEAQEVKQCRQLLVDWVKNHPVFGLWQGNTLLQKLQQIDYQAAQLGNLSTTEKQEQAKQWRTELETKQKSLEKTIDAIRTNYDEQHQKLFSEMTSQKTTIEQAIDTEIKAVRQEINLDNKLFDESYREILRTRIQLLGEQQQQEQNIEVLNEEIRLVREAIAALP